MPKYKDALRIVRHRFAFFRGEVPEAGGKALMYRLIQSEPELEMLEAIENLYEPTTYTYEPGMFVDYITPEVCRHVCRIYMEKGLGNAGGDDATSGSPTAKDSDIIGGGQPKCKRLKVGAG